MRKLGKYEVLGELGHGAMGVVYRARDPVINRLVALKTVTTGLADDPNLLQRFYREAQSAGGLQHPNIVTIYDMGDEENVPYIAMELIVGESLEQIIAHRTNLPVALKLTYALQACRAFDYAHKRGIIHRDIKPGNVMVNKESVVKVVDFGIARVLETSKTQTGMLIGTFAYMSPEQYHGEHADERSDIWSFGVLLYELLCYQRPFTGENPASLMHSICQHQPRPLLELAPDCPPELETIISRTLQKSPQDRCQSMEDLLLELEPVYKELQSRSIAEHIDRSRQLIKEGGFAQARELLRESLRVDSANTQARVLLEKVNSELKRILIRPRAQQHVERAGALIEEGRIEEARAEVESALELDSTLEAAQELHERVQHELNRAQMVAEWLQSSRQRLAEGMPDEAEALLAQVLQADPSNKQVSVLQQQAQTEKAERQRRLRFLEKMQEARGLWTQQKYQDSIEILAALRKEFPGEEEIQKLLETVLEDQADQYRQNTLERARNLLAGSHYPECRALLLELQEQFPNDSETSRLLDDVRLDEAKQRRLQGVAEARSCLASGRYQESIALLVSLEKEFPDDKDVPRLLKRAREDQAEQHRQQRIVEARNLLAARRYEDCNALLTTLRTEFPNDGEIPELLNAVRRDQAEQRKLRSLTEARNLLAARQHEQSIALLTELGKEFPGEQEILRLLATAREGRAEQHRQQRIVEARDLLAARRYEDCNALLTKLRTEFPNDGEIPELLNAVRKGQAEQHKLKGLTEARNLLAARQHEQSITLLVSLEKEFPDDEDIPRLLKRAREDQAEQYKLKSLSEARNLLASRRYEESIALLTALREEFSNEPEIPRLLTNAGKEQAEQQKQQKLSEARALLAAQRFSEALVLVDSLRAAHPHDTAIQKLRALIESEQDKQTREEVLQRELEGLKKLVSQQKYSDILSRAETLRVDFPGNVDLLRLIDFAHSQLLRIDNDKRLRAAIDEAKAHSQASRFKEAISVAHAGLKAFPDNAELLYLCEQAESQQKKQHRRALIEERIREIKFKINREDFSEAIDLAKETLATTGPDADLTQLLSSALVEFEAREKKRKQEQKLQEIRTMMESGNIDRAAEALNDAVTTETFDAFDPRVSHISQEIEVAKSTPHAPSPEATPPAPVKLSKEYAFQQGAPAEVEPPPSEKVGPSETSVSRASVSQPIISSQAVVPRPPQFIPAPAVIPSTVTQPTAASQPLAPPLAPVSVPEPTVPTAMPPQPAPSTTLERMERISAQRRVPQRPGDFKKPAIIGTLALGLILAVWVGMHFFPPAKTEVSRVGTKPSVQTTSNATPSVNPADLQQRNALEASDRLITGGNLKGALEVLQEVEKLNGSLTPEIKSKEATVNESMLDENLAKLRQQEATLWQQATNEVQKSDLDAAKRDLRRIISLGDGGVRKNDAQNILDNVIPRRQKEEDFFRQATQSAQANDPQDLQRAADLFGQVMALKGPRQAQAAELQRNVEANLSSLKLKDANRQITALESAARENIQQGDLNGARQKVDQIKQTGGDATTLSREIDQAQLMQTRSAQQQREFQQAVQAYDALGGRDKSGLEKSRSDFQAILRENGPQAGDAQKYVAEINRKLEALIEPPSPPPAKAEANATASDDGAIRGVIQMFFHAFEQRNPDALNQVWPSISEKRYDGYKNSFEQASAIIMQVVSETVKISPDGATAAVSAQTQQQYTPKGQKLMKSAQLWSFQLAKKNGAWVITDVH